MINFTCHGCGRTLQVKDEFAGKKARCPRCGVVGPVAGATASAADSKAVKFCSRCGGSLSAGARFCSACGSPVSGTSTLTAEAKIECPICHEKTTPGKPSCDHCKLPIADMALLRNLQKQLVENQRNFRSRLSEDARRVLDADEYVAFLTPGEQGRKIYVVTDRRVLVFAVEEGPTPVHSLERMIEFGDIVSHSDLDSRSAGPGTVWSFFTLETQNDGEVEFRFLAGDPAHDQERQQHFTFYYHFLGMHQTHVRKGKAPAVMLRDAKL